MTNTPDETKKGLECCRNMWDCKNMNCPYLGDGCYPKLHEDLKARMEQLEAERDALAADFKLYRERNIKGECGVYACDLCKLGGKYEKMEEIKCPEGCMGIENWEWRGVQKEE